jgi:hypothetical protein
VLLARSLFVCHRLSAEVIDRWVKECVSE